LRVARYAALGVIVCSVAAGTFVASYPYLWPDPLGRSLALFHFRAEEMATQASAWPEMAVPTRLEALRRTANNFSERYTLSDVLAQHLLGSRAPRIARQIELLLALIGIVLIAAAAARDGPFGPRALAFAVLAGQCVVTLLGMRSEFD